MQNSNYYQREGVTLGGGGGAVALQALCSHSETAPVTTLSTDA